MTVVFRSVLVFLVTSFVLGASAQIPNNYITQQQDLPCLNKRFSLRVHTTFSPVGPPMFDTSAFLAMVELANEAFSPVCISFEACEFLEVENYRYHSHENNDPQERESIYGSPNRIDVYIPNIDSMSQCGLASLGGIAEPATAFVTVTNECISPTSGTLTHELGHFFGLYHTFETQFGQELVNGDNCDTAGDLICDTPADPYVENSSIQWTDTADPCLFIFEGLDDNGQYYVPHTANAMSYYADECSCGFTRGQLERIAANCIAAPDGYW